MGSQDKRTEIRKREGKEIFILVIEYLMKSFFSGIHFKMDVFKNSVKRAFCSTSRYLDGKEKSRKTKIKEITKEKEKKRQENQKNEVIKRKKKKKNKKKRKK